MSDIEQYSVLWVNKVDGWKNEVKNKTDRQIQEQLNRTDIIPEWRSILMHEQKFRERTSKVKVSFS